MQLSQEQPAVWGAPLPCDSHADGWRLALVDLNDAGNAETLALVRNAGGEGLTHHMDVSQPAAWEQLRDKLAADWSHLDLLVNNAGVAGSGDVGKYAIDDWQWIISINLNAGIYGCHYFIPWLKKNPRGAHIINVASLAAVASRPGMAGYNVTKAEWCRSRKRSTESLSRST